MHKMDLYVKWILSKQQWCYSLDARSRYRSCCASLTVASQTTIGVDANQGIPGDIVERHRGNASDFYLLCLGLSEEAKVGQTCAHRQRDRQLDKAPTIQVTVRRFDHFHLLPSSRLSRQERTAACEPTVRISCRPKT